MAWWRVLMQKVGRPLGRDEYRVAFSLYSADGMRSAEIRERRNGQAYFVEREWVEGTIFSDLRPGEEIGPYENPEAAEAAAICRPWFSDGKSSS